MEARVFKTENTKDFAKFDKYKDKEMGYYELANIIAIESGKDNSLILTDKDWNYFVIRDLRDLIIIG